MTYTHVSFPASGSAITLDTHTKKLIIPDNPIIPFIEGDGIGVDITPVMQSVIDAAVSKAYADKKKISWLEIYAGDKATAKYGTDNYLPSDTIQAIKDFKVAIKGPLATPIGGGIRSLNVALRQELDLYICQRPVSWFTGVPSPVTRPQDINMVVFRENSEDIYAGIEWSADSREARQLIDFLQTSMNVKNIRFSNNCGIGIKPVSMAGSQRLIRQAIEYAITHDLPSVTLVHKGNIMKFTEGAFRDWGYELAIKEFNATESTEHKGWYEITNPNTGNKIILKDVIADAFLQAILLHPTDYSVIATLNLNGDYISDALAAQVGGIGIAPGANIGEDCAIFEATHGTAPTMAGNNSANPCSLLLSGVMMLEHIGWTQAANLISKSIARAIANKTVTTDFHRAMDGAKLLTSSEFGEEVIKNL